MMSRFGQAFSQKVSVNRKVLPWMVRYASWLLTHCLVKVDGEIP